MINIVKFKMMKKNLALIAFAFVGLFGVYKASAQDQCTTNLSLFVQDVKVKNYDSAYGPWKDVYENCDPKLHFATYYYGEKILKHKLETDEANRATYIEMLLGLYDKYHANFPSKESLAEAASDKAILMNKEKMGTDEEIYNMLDDAFTNDKAHFTNEIAMYLYFTKLVDLHKAGKADLQKVFDTYDNISDKMETERTALAKEMNELLPLEEAGSLDSKQERTLKNNRIKTGNYEDISGSMDTYLGQLADCDNLIPLYQKNFEANKDNAEWLNRAAARMSEKDCTGDPMFVKVVEQLHGLKPTASSAYYLGVLNEKQGKGSKALEYFKEAITLETDNFKKSSIQLKIAAKYLSGSPSTAASYARQSLSSNPSNTKAYDIIARAYAASANSCGTDTFSKKAVYWLAAAEARKGGHSKLAESYEGYAPSKQEIFTAGMAGKTIKIGCWINKSVTVPSL